MSSLTRFLISNIFSSSAPTLSHSSVPFTDSIYSITFKYSTVYFLKMTLSLCNQHTHSNQEIIDTKIPSNLTPHSNCTSYQNSAFFFFILIHDSILEHMLHLVVTFCYFLQSGVVPVLTCFCCPLSSKK